MQILKEVNKEWNLPSIICPDILSHESPDYGYFVSKDFVLAFYIKHRLGFKNMRFVLEPIPLTVTANIENEKQFLNDIVTTVKNKRLADFIGCPDTTCLFSTVPDGSTFCPFGSYIIDLRIEEEVLFSNLHSKHRNVIKKAEKEGIVISTEQKYMDGCINLVKDTLQRQNMTIRTASYFDSLKSRSDLDYFVALQGDDIHGAAILAWTSGRSSYYLYGGSSITPCTGAMNLLHWEAMKIMKKRGVMYYNFVGARLSPISGRKLEGIQRFKSRFGGDMKEGFLWKIKINKMKSWLFYCLLNLYSCYKHINTKDIIDQENGL